MLFCPQHNVFHPGCGVTRAVSVLGHVPKFSSKVDTSLRHVGNNRGHDQYVANIGQAKRISAFTENPIRKAIISSAEKVTGWFNFSAAKKTENSDNFVEAKY